MLHLGKISSHPHIYNRFTRKPEPKSEYPHPGDETSPNERMNLIKEFLIRFLDYFRYKKSYAQSGEDVALASFYEHLKGYKGFYVDVGAHHPVRFSNTLYFYRKGWRGINLDAMPGSMLPFKWFRWRDINMETGIGPKEGSLTFFCFNEPALNTFDESLARNRDTGTPYRIVKKVDVPVQPLRKVFADYLPKNQQIDFLSLDVEGFDLAVLKSNDWEMYKPLFIVVEITTNSISNLYESEIHVYLASKGYEPVCVLKRSCIYKSTTIAFS